MSDILSYTNTGAIRNRPLVPILERRIAEAVQSVYGPGFTAQVYSGGQEAKGQGRRRTGSVRHDLGRAADVYIVGPDGNRVTGDELAPLAQYWSGKKYGGVGLEMRSGGIHLDAWETPPKGGGMSWNYASKGGRFTPAQRNAVAAGLAGELPDMKGRGMAALVDRPKGFDPVKAGAVALDDAPMAFAPQSSPAGAAKALDAMASGQVAQAMTVSAAPVPFDPVKAGAVPFDPVASGAVPVGQTPQMQPPAISHPEFDPANVPGGVPGYNPETGLVESPVSDKIGAFITGLSDLPIVGPAMKSGAAAGAAGILSATGGRSFGEEYEYARGLQDRVTSENPKTALAGNIAGAVGAMIPLGATAVGGKLLGITGNSLGQRALLSGATNSLIGATDTAVRGGSDRDVAQSAAISGAIGGAVPLVGAGLNALGRSVRDAVAPRLNALVNPTQEAGRRVGQAIATDRANTLAKPLTAADEASASLNNQPLMNVDRGGEQTRALARSAANQNPEAREIIARTVDDRFTSQGQRAQSFVSRIMNGATDDLALQDRLKEAARKANRPAYDKAYREGSDMILTPEMERLTSSPAVAEAMRKVAEGAGRNRAVAEGFGSFNPRVTVTPDGRIKFNATKAGGSPAFPDLQFWDYTKRELDDMANAAARSGRNSEADTIRSLARTLRSELDSQVPSYANARQGAAAFFGAEDAIEAGKKFVVQSRTIPETRRALAKMTPEERASFAVGFASELKDAIAQSRDRVNVINQIFGSQQAREKISLALGPARFKEFEQFVRVENTMDMLRGAMGNSTTARQLVELGLAGSAGGAAGILTGDWKTGIGAALLVRGARAYGAKVDEAMAKRVAELLISDDPKAIERAVQLAAKNPRAAQAVEAIQKFISTATKAAGTTVTRPQPLELTVRPSDAR